MNFPFRYALGESAVEVKIGGKTVRRIPYADIEAVESKYPLWNENWVNFYPFRFVSLRRKSGWVRNFVINPTDADQFMNDLKARIP